MPQARRRTLGIAVVLTVVTGAGALRAQSAAVQVGARVAPQCVITVGSAAGDRSPAVTVSCGASAVRALRVTTTSGDEILPVRVADGRQLKAGGDFLFVIAQPVAAVASLVPAAPVSASRSRTVTVTLDF